MCWYCGSPIQEEGIIGRSALCKTCGKWLRSCRNCRFYLPDSRGKCEESQAETVTDKEGSNFCDWFSLNTRFRSTPEGGNKAAQEARKAFDNLFGE